MEQTYLVALIQVLSQDERVLLSLFLRSPFFNSGANQDRINLLFDLLAGQEEETLTKEDLYAMIFPDSPWVAGKLDKLMSELSGMIRQFLLVRHYMDERHSFTQSLDWASIIRERGLHSRYAQNLSKAESILQQNTYKSTDYYYQYFQLVYKKYEVESQQNRIKGDLYIPETIASLDTFYLAYRLELQNLLLLQQKLTRIDLPEYLNLGYPDFISRQVWEGNVLLTVLTKINEQLNADTPSISAFQEILDLLEEYGNQIDPGTLQNFYAHIRSLCTLMIQQGEVSFMPLLHEIQRDNLKQGYLFLDGKLSPSAYLSVARIAIRVGKNQWALDFTEKYKDLLIEEADTENYYRFNKAECLFSISRYEEALDLLPQSFTDLIYLTNCKRLEIKLYYELNSDLLPYKIDAFKMFISRASKKVITDYVREMEGNFVNIVLQIVQCTPGDTDKIDRIIRRIQDKKIIGDRDWLLEKVQQLR